MAGRPPTIGEVMRALSKNLTFYTYLRATSREDWWKCVEDYIAKLREKGFRYVPSEFGDCRKSPQDIYDNGAMGALLLFRAVGNPLNL